MHGRADVSSLILAFSLLHGALGDCSVGVECSAEKGFYCANTVSGAACFDPALVRCAIGSDFTRGFQSDGTVCYDDEGLAYGKCKTANANGVPGNPTSVTRCMKNSRFTECDSKDDGSPCLDNKGNAKATCASRTTCQSAWARVWVRNASTTTETRPRVIWVTLIPSAQTQRAKCIVFHLRQAPAQGNLKGKHAILMIHSTRNVRAQVGARPVVHITRFGKTCKVERVRRVVPVGMRASSALAPTKPGRS